MKWDRATYPCGLRFCGPVLRMLWGDKAFPVPLIANITGGSASSVYRRAETLLIDDQRHKRRKPIYSVKRFAALWANPALTVAEIAVELGMSADLVSLHARRMRLPHRKTGARRRHIWPSDFVQMWAQGVTTREIAALVGCSGSLVSNHAARCGLPARAQRMLANRKTMAEFRDWQLVQAMASDGLAVRAAFKKANMWDVVSCAKKVRVA